MNHLGYECRYKSENVSQYISPLKIFGEVDFIHAFRAPSIAMLKRTEKKSIYDGTMTIRVLKPEDIIGLKIQSIKNDNSRSGTDMADIKMLLKLQKNSIDYSIIEGHAKLLGMEYLLKEILEEESE